MAVRCGRDATWPPPVVDMLLAAWGAAVGHPAYVTTAVADLTGAPARSFRDWVAAHADGFRNAGGQGERPCARQLSVCVTYGSSASRGPRRRRAPQTARTITLSPSNVK
jgi:hypothetical protein